jgi:alcohol dehydrogenase
MQDLSLYIPSRIFCSPGALRHLPEIAEKLGNRFLLITDGTLAGSPGVNKIRTLIEDNGGEVMVFTDLPLHSDSRSAEEAVELAKVSRLHGVLGFGGMRALSIARMTALAAPGPFRVDDILSGTSPDWEALPYIEIPGVLRHPWALSSSLMMVDARKGAPVMLHRTGLYPYALFMDPELLESVTAKYRIAVLLDTLLLSVEGYLSGKNSFMSETHFLKAVALALGSIESLQQKREEEASFFAAQSALFNAFGTLSGSPGAGTALSWSIGVHRSLPKSVVSTVLLPHMLEYGLRVAPEKVSRMGNILGENLKGLSVVAAADRTVDRLRNSLGSHDLPGRLQELGVKKEDFGDIVSMARELPFLSNGPAPISGEDLLELLRLAF